MSVQRLDGGVRRVVGELSHRSGPDRYLDQEGTGPVRSLLDHELGEVLEFLKEIDWRPNYAREREELVEEDGGKVVWGAMEEYEAAARKREIRNPSGYFSRIVRRLRAERRENVALAGLEEHERKSAMVRAFALLKKRGTAQTAEAVRRAIFEVLARSKAAQA